MQGGVENKQLQIAHPAPLDAVAQRVEKEDLKTMLESSKVRKSIL